MSVSITIDSPVFEIGDIVTPIYGSRYGGPAKGMTGVVVNIRELNAEPKGHRYLVDVKWDEPDSHYRSREELGIFDNSCWSFYNDELALVESARANWQVGEISEFF